MAVPLREERHEIRLLNINAIMPLGFRCDEGRKNGTRNFSNEFYPFKA